MKTLTVFRHAKSSWSDPSLPDRERPLSGRGERDATDMGARLRARGHTPDLILTSHAVRALSTAQAIAAALGMDASSIAVERRLYLAAPEAVLDVLAEQDDRIGHIVVIGHNPGLTELVNRLLPTFGLDDMPTAGVVTLSIDTPSWHALEGTARALLFYDFPKNVISPP